MTVRKDDIGTVFEVTVKDNGIVVDVSSVSVKQIKFLRPDGTINTQTAAFKTNGTDGIITYTAVSGDLNASGVWRAQAYIEWAAGWKGHSDMIPFKVYDNVADL